MPWYVLIGAPGSGKTAIVRQIAVRSLMATGSSQCGKVPPGPSP
jgi:type VI protein secretion system component VasK